MSARFRVESTFAITERGLFLLAGEVVEGAVCPGMVLTLECEDEIDLSLWRGLNLGGHVFAVVEPGAERQEPPRKPWWKLW